MSRVTVAGSGPKLVPAVSFRAERCHVIQRGSAPVSHGHRRADARRRARLRGGSTLAVLVAITTAALMVIVAQFALIAPHQTLGDTLRGLSRPSPVAAPTGRSYGACGDICSEEGGCRHVLLRNGLHNGDRVPEAVMVGADACW